MVQRATSVCISYVIPSTVRFLILVYDGGCNCAIVASEPTSGVQAGGCSGAGSGCSGRSLEWVFGGCDVVTIMSVGLFKLTRSTLLFRMMCFMVSTPYVFRRTLLAILL